MLNIVTISASELVTVPSERHNYRNVSWLWNLHAAKNCRFGFNICFLWFFVRLHVRFLNWFKAWQIKWRISNFYKLFFCFLKENTSELKYRLFLSLPISKNTVMSWKMDLNNSQTSLVFRASKIDAQST